MHNAPAEQQNSSLTASAQSIIVIVVVLMIIIIIIIIIMIQSFQCTVFVVCLLHAEHRCIPRVTLYKNQNVSVY